MSTMIFASLQEFNTSPSGLYFFTMWREGYDYPSDDDEQDNRDLLDRADEAHEQQNDK